MIKDGLPRNTPCRIGPEPKRRNIPPFGSAALIFVSITAVSAQADCITSGTETTCTGDLSGGESIDADGITSITIEKLTTDAGRIQITATGDDGSTGTTSPTDGGVGASTTGFELTFDGGDDSGTATYGIDSISGDAVDIELTAGSGGKGGATSGDFGGYDGGDVADTTFEIDNATTFEGEASAFFYSTLGGDGGTGGNIKNTATEAGYAGDGGDGGTGGGQSLKSSTGEIAEMSSGTGSFIYMTSQGGDGGAGGKGTGETLAGTNLHGGDGGDGGSGGDITIEFDATATGSTSSDDTPVVWVESLAGEGGNGGKISGGAVGWKSGDGGAGAVGGAVNVTVSNGSIATTGNRSIGLFARSYGGDGGSRGSNNTDYGAKGDDGAGGSVNVTFGGTIRTRDTNATGALLQSVGGFGGDATSTEITTYGESSLGGGAGGAVEFTLSEDATIATVADGADSVHVQSVGGSGGKGNDSDNITALGGDGANGGDGGTATVTINDNATVNTAGEHSNAIAALSIGGGGGSGGAATGITSVGGSGGAGGKGKLVTVAMGAATVRTGQTASDGVYAASIGGGGGKARSTSGVSTVGGSGGDGGDGGAVVVSLDGTSIKTKEADANGVMAQSIGGGGGTSGWTSYIDTFSGTSLQSTVGGDGGKGGNAARVRVNHQENNTLTVTGPGAVAIRAQSIGGSGGSSGITVSGDVAGGDSGLVIDGDATLGDLSATVEGNGGDGGTSGTVTLDNDGTVTTTGDYEPALIAQSLAGGGGSATGVISGTVTMAELTATLGGSGGDGGTSNTVTVKSTDTVSTSGVSSEGILAQSLGGEGGTGGYVISGNLGGGEYTGDVTFAYGGDGGDGGTAGEVLITNEGEIVTGDYGSAGIQAQSIGGSGGNGGSVYSGTLSVRSSATIDTNVTLGGKGGGSRIGGYVEILNSGDITTDGAMAPAIAAQSVGGMAGPAAVLSPSAPQEMSMATSTLPSRSVATAGQAPKVATYTSRTMGRPSSRKNQDPQVFTRNRLGVMGHRR